MPIAPTVLAGSLAFGLAGLLQDRLLLQPPRLAGMADPAVGVDLRDARGAPVGWVREPAARAKATMLVFHGNAGCAQDHGPLADALARRGWRVVSIEYPGYCGRPGGASVDALLDDAVAQAAEARSRWPGPVVLAGYSLGAAVAAVAADPASVPGDRPPADGLLMFTPWASFRALAAHHFPWLPARWLTTARMETIDRVGRVLAAGVPVVAVGAERDTIVPVGQARALARQPGIAYLELAGAGHNDWLARLEPAQWDAIDAALAPARAAQEPDSAPDRR